MPDRNSLGNTRLRDLVFSGLSIKRTPALIAYLFAILITLLTIFVRFKFGITSDHRPLVALIHTTNITKRSTRRLLAWFYLNSFSHRWHRLFYAIPYTQCRNARYFLIFFNWRHSHFVVSQ